jgi:hypothetical protein
MDKAEKNRQFILDYYKAISGRDKTGELLSCFTTDPELIEQLLLCERLFPKHELIIDEITCEGERVIVRSRARGKYIGSAADFAPSCRVVETTFAIGYRVSRGKIVDHWMIADSLELLEQLGF